MSTRPVLVIGGGIAGMSFAIRMREQGREVELVEADPEWRVYGAGISITGPTIRAFKRLGLLDQLRERGFSTSHPARICAPTGQVVAEVPAQSIEAGLPVVGGIMRPVLHNILSQRTREVATRIRLGVTATKIESHATGVRVEFSDGSTSEYDFVVAADGAFSKTRQLLFPSYSPPRYTGQYCWRLVADRPAQVDRPHFFMAGPITAGLMPVSPTQMYMFLLQVVPERVHIDPDIAWHQLKHLMSSFGGLLAELREQLGPKSIVNARPLDAILLPLPWHKGRVVLIGDAAHATTPHLASGAGIAVEDALVLSELLAEHPDPISAFERLGARRWERCRMVVENSVQIGQMQQTDASPEKLKALMNASQRELAADI